jgi:MFS family permease
VQWVVNAYVLPFGGLLLLGGRIADYVGRRRVLLAATIGFAAASGVAGAADSEAMLFAARAAQGLFAAAMAPALLAMITIEFPSGRDRDLAFSLYAGVSAAGAALGFVVGGLLTRYASWRWCRLINLPISGLVLAGGALLRESRAGAPKRYDAHGAVAATLGLLGLLYGISSATRNGWGSVVTLGPLCSGCALLMLFVVWEARADNPLLPLGLLRSRTRISALLAVATAYGAATGMFLLALLFIQGPQHRRSCALLANVGLLCHLGLVPTKDR